MIEETVFWCVADLKATLLGGRNGAVVQGMVLGRMRRYFARKLKAAWGPVGFFRCRRSDVWYVCNEP